MTQFPLHELAAQRHRDRCAVDERTAATIPVVAVLITPRRRLGLLLVEAGLHLIAGADRPRLSVPAYR